VLDPFTLNFLNASDPESVEGKLALGLIPQLGRVDTARVECFHAWVKRLTTRLGAQASRPNFQDVAARVFCHRVKERQAAHEPWMGRPVAATDDANQPEHDEGQGGPPGKALRTGGGGSWRAHCKRMFSQGVRDYATLGPAYRERSAELVQADLEAGAEATARRRRGSQPSATRRSVWSYRDGVLWRLLPSVTVAMATLERAMPPTRRPWLSQSMLLTLAVLSR